MRERNFTLSGAEKFRYSFQGQEHDDEIKGEGNSVNFEFRMYDPRVARFLSDDPLKHSYPDYTPYSFSGNKVIYCRELEGKEEIIATMDPNMDSYQLTWDVTARMRPGEKGKILYQTWDGQVLEEMRSINTLEMKNTFINSRVNMPTNSTNIVRPNNTLAFLPKGQSATCTNSGAEGEQDQCQVRVPLEFACPPLPPPPPPPVNDKSNSNSSSNITKTPLSEKQMNAINQAFNRNLTDGSVLINKGGPTSVSYNVNMDEEPMSIGGILKQYTNVDLTNTKVVINFSLARTATDMTRFSKGKLDSDIRKLFIKYGFKNGNVQVNFTETPNTTSIRINVNK